MLLLEMRQQESIKNPFKYTLNKFQNIAIFQFVLFTTALNTSDGLKPILVILKIFGYVSTWFGYIQQNSPFIRQYEIKYLVRTWNVPKN